MAEELATFSRFLLAANKKVNLISVKSSHDLLWKHLLDSLVPLRIDDLGKKLGAIAILDLGSGGGFPGIPLKIVKKELNIYLLEANGKKASFLQRAVNRLSLKNAEVLAMRAEEAARIKYREYFDLVISRAVASLPVLLELALPLVKVGGFFWAYKGPDVESELEESKKALEVLGGKINKLYKFSFPEESGIKGRSLVEIFKCAKTPFKYPRRPGIPAKKPIL